MELRRKNIRDRSTKTKNKFQALRNLRNNNLTTSEYLNEKEKDSVKIYDEVDETEYAKHRLEQQDLDDFVVEDDVGGYIDRGQENESEGMYSDSDEDNHQHKRKKNKDKDKKGKSDIEQRNTKMNSFFKNIQPKNLNGSKLSKEKKVNSAAESMFLESIFQDLDKKTTTGKKRKPDVRPSIPVKKEKSSKIEFNGRTLESIENKRIQKKADKIVIKTEPIPENNNQKGDIDNYDFDNIEFQSLEAEDLETESKQEKEKESAESKANMLLFEDEEEGADDWLTLQKDIKQAVVNPDNILNDLNTNIPLSKNSSMDSEDINSIDVFWLDAFENNGVVYLFGKTPNKNNEAYSSVCIAVRGIERNLFVLPRVKPAGSGSTDDSARYSISEVHKELESIMNNYKIREFASKPTQRKYAFEEPGIPADTEYLKVVYGFDSPQLPIDIAGEKIEKVFGTTYSAHELLFLKRRMMGPCWIRISGIQKLSPKLSWCRQEYYIDNPKMIQVLTDDECIKCKHPKVPKLCVASISIKTILNVKKNSNEIVAASFMCIPELDIESTHPITEAKSEQIVVVRQLEGVPFPVDFERLATQNSSKAIEARGGQNIKVAKTERELLSFVIGNLARTDPDIIIGHNYLGFLLDVMLHRMRAGKVADWSKLGRMKRHIWPKLQAGVGGMSESTFSERQVMAGRVVCDSYLVAKDLVRAKSYSLSNLSQLELNIKREEFSLDKVTEAFMNTSSPDPLLRLCRHTSFDAYLCMLLVHRLQALPLTKQLTNLAGNIWSRTMVGARAERNEYLLLHEFYRLKFIRPDKLYGGFSSKPDKKLQTSSNNSGNNKKGNSTEPKNDTNPELSEVQNGDAELEILDNTAYDAEDSDDGGQENSGTVNNQNNQGKSRGRRKPAFSGGLVLEPKRGLYDQYVLLLDFNSLYPSIIREFNICFTTVERTNSDDQIPPNPDPSLPPGSLPKLLKNLIEKRKQVKNLLKAPGLPENERMALDVRQKALKLTANSMYGCLGFANSRFYAKSLAVLITAKGRQILLDTQSLAESKGFQVLYGDTDSIMVNTTTNKLSEAYDIGNQLKRQVNEQYKLLELDIDGVFRRLLLLRKKKYAALLVTGNAKQIKSENVKNDDLDNPDVITEEVPTTLETRGLDLVRRDWCEISHDVSSFVLNKILSGSDSDTISSTINSYLAQVSAQVRSNKVLISKYVINKGLSKPPEMYKESNALPHVSVALRMKKSGHAFSSGDTVPYVIGINKEVVNVDQETNKAPTSHESGLLGSKAYHPEEIKNSNGKIVVDAEWYITQQILPPIARLCEPIEGIDMSRLAISLGLDPVRYKSSYGSKSNTENNDELKTFESQIPDSERFKDAYPFEIKCSQCNNIYGIDGIASIRNGYVYSGVTCSCGATPNTATVITQLQLQIRKQISMFMQTDYECTDVGCGYKTKTLQINTTISNSNNIRCHRQSFGCQGILKRVYTERMLYNQLLYFTSLFSLEKTKKRLCGGAISSSALQNQQQMSNGSGSNIQMNKDLESQVDRQYSLSKSLHDSCANVCKSYLDCSSFKFIDLGSLFRYLKL
ncbi:hypothetical protein BB558_004382 [Smittium angustum]|uniref:DNA polymerase n=1 Tax=Smittium angustum TaxID=133377 RepID=A0A2U1J3H1_SMIAN|nr:hypothetical protein BB558_004382 [Smittium angustum]